MSDEEIYFINAQDEAERYIRHVDEALSASDPQEMRSHLQEALSVGQTLMDVMDDSLRTIDDMDTADRIEEAMRHLGMSLDQGEQALEMPDEDLEDAIMEMRRHADQAVTLLGQMAT